MIDQKLDNRRLSRNNSANERRASTPSWITDALVEQVIDIQGIVKQRVLRVAHHRIVAEVGMGIDIVAELKCQLYSIQPLGFRNARERTRTLAGPGVETSRYHQGCDAGLRGHFGIRAALD